MQCKCGHTYTVASYCNNTDCTVLCKCPSPVCGEVLSPLSRRIRFRSGYSCTVSECRIVSIYHLAYARSAVLRFRDDVGARGRVVPMRRSVQRGHAPGSIITPRVVYSPCATLRRCMAPISVCASGRGRPTLFVGSVMQSWGSACRQCWSSDHPHGVPPTQAVCANPRVGWGETVI
jgi:hypothetical protein